MVDIATEWLMDLATAFKSLDRAGTDIDSCWRHKLAAEENKSACELMATYLRALFSQSSKFFTGTEHLSLVEMPISEVSGSSRGGGGWGGGGRFLWESTG